MIKFLKIIIEPYDEVQPTETFYNMIINSSGIPFISEGCSDIIMKMLKFTKFIKICNGISVMKVQNTLRTLKTKKAHFFNLFSVYIFHISIFGHRFLYDW